MFFPPRNKLLVLFLSTINQSKERARLLYSATENCHLRFEIVGSRLKPGLPARSLLVSFDLQRECFSIRSY